MKCQKCNSFDKSIAVEKILNIDVSDQFTNHAGVVFNSNEGTFNPFFLVGRQYASQEVLALKAAAEKYISEESFALGRRSNLPRGVNSLTGNLLIWTGVLAISVAIWSWIYMPIFSEIALVLGLFSAPYVIAGIIIKRKVKKVKASLSGKDHADLQARRLGSYCERCGVFSPGQLAR